MTPDEDFDRLAEGEAGNTRTEVRRLQRMLVVHAREERGRFYRLEQDIGAIREIIETWRHVRWFGKLVRRGFLFIAGTVAAFAALSHWYDVVIAWFRGR